MERWCATRLQRKVFLKMGVSLARKRQGFVKAFCVLYKQNVGRLEHFVEQVCPDAQHLPGGRWWVEVVVVGV